MHVKFFQHLVTLVEPETREPQILKYDTLEDAVKAAEGYRADKCSYVKVYMWNLTEGGYDETAF